MRLVVVIECGWPMKKHEAPRQAGASKAASVGNRRPLYRRPGWNLPGDDTDDDGTQNRGLRGHGVVAVAKLSKSWLDVAGLSLSPARAPRRECKR